MAHQIDSMAYAGETPWHGLGTYLGEKDVDSKRMIEAAGLGWTVSKRQLLIPSAGFPLPESNASADADAPVILRPEPFKVYGTDLLASGSYVMEAPNLFATVRDDRGTVLGMDSEDYEPFQNAEAFAFMDELLGFDGVNYHTAGSLFDGKKVWALVQIGGHISIRRKDGSEDPLGKFLLCSFGHDGHTPIVIQCTSVRVVCWNTLSAALRDKSNAVKIVHSSGMRDKIAQIRESIGISINYFDQLTQAAQQLEDTDMRRAEFRDFADRLLIDTAASVESAKESMGKAKRTHHDAHVDRLTDLFDHGLGNFGRTRWDALNAVTQDVDHKPLEERAGTTEMSRRSNRLKSSWFGAGAEIKARALKMLTR